jgi:hypothetical protein
MAQVLSRLLDSLVEAIARNNDPTIQWYDIHCTLRVAMPTRATAAQSSQPKIDNFAFSFKTSYQIVLLH